MVQNALKDFLDAPDLVLLLSDFRGVHFATFMKKVFPPLTSEHTADS